MISSIGYLRQLFLKEQYTPRGSDLYNINIWIATERVFPPTPKYYAIKCLYNFFLLNKQKFAVFLYRCRHKSSVPDNIYTTAMQ